MGGGGKREGAGRKAERGERKESLTGARDADAS